MSRRRKYRKKKSRKKLAYGLIAVTFIFACFLAYFYLHSSGKKASPEAALMDHLSFTGQPNQTFVDTCINILKKGGLTWAYYRGRDVTVDFYRNLPSYGSSLIILRVHSAIMKTEEGIVSILGLFTSEPYSDEAAREYRDDVLNDRLVKAFFTEGGDEYFGIVPKFIEESMKGEFENTIIIMMGCEGLGYEGLTYTAMAEAFVNKGAKVYISWDGPVGVSHTDQATVCLLQHLISEKQNIGKAVEETKEEVGKDPTYNSTLQYYPKTAEVGNYTIPNLRSSLTMNVAYTPPTPRASKGFKYTAHVQG